VRDCGRGVLAIQERPIPEPGKGEVRVPLFPLNVLLPVPDDLPDEQVASFFINPASAILMLRHCRD
jgi:NADPH:quinone reductase-like Zn-dependent oxidoreductase